MFTSNLNLAGVPFLRPGAAEADAVAAAGALLEDIHGMQQKHYGLKISRQNTSRATILDQIRQRPFVIGFTHMMWRLRRRDCYAKN